MAENPIEPLPVVLQAQVLYKDYTYIISSSGYDFVYDNLLNMLHSTKLSEEDFDKAVKENDRIAVYGGHWSGDHTVTELVWDKLKNPTQIKYIGLVWKRSDGRLINEAKMVAEYNARKAGN